MHNEILGLALLAAGVAAAPVERQTACSSYTIIDTRGTGESQGESSAFTTMNSNVRSQMAGGTIYNTVYPAGFDQDSSAGTTDIVNHITSTLSSSPGMCFILEGYSQGAAATVNAMSRLTGANFDAVKGVVLVGNPEHKAGLACNVDTSGGSSTANVNGVSEAQGSIPSNWVSKTLDICNYGDGICDTTHGSGINSEHLDYPTDSNVQNMGTKYILAALGSGSSGSGSNAPATTTTAAGAVPTVATATTAGLGGLPTGGLGLTLPTAGGAGFALPSAGGAGLALPTAGGAGLALPTAGGAGLALPTAAGAGAALPTAAGAGAALPSLSGFSLGGTTGTTSTSTSGFSIPGLATTMNVIKRWTFWRA